MRPAVKLLAVLLLALAPAALTSVTPAQAQPYGRGEGRGEGRRESRQVERRGGPDRGGGYRGPAYRGGYGGGPVYGAPYPVPYPVYPQGPVYNALPGGYAYAPPSGYVPDSLGADWGQQQDQARSGVREGRLLPLGRIMQMISRATPGRLLDAGLEPGPDGRPAYRVRWAATGGRRIDFIVDAVSGAILARTGY